MTTLLLRSKAALGGVRMHASMALLLLAFLALIGAAAAMTLMRQQPASAEVKVQLPLVGASEAAALVAQTSASSTQIHAVGDRAKLLNAALPFSGDPVEAAASFALSGGALDHQRALLCLTQAVYYEAGFEPLAGRRAVAQVVLNRMRHPAFPKSVCGVVYQGSNSPVCQFSFVCDGSLYRAPATGAWREARTVAEAALAGYVERSVGAATHYHADYVAPRWAPMLAKIEKIGAHIFYRWPGAWGRRAAFNGRYAGEPRDPNAMRPAPPSQDEALELAALPAPAESGPPVARAPNDVGGLLDVSKGWSLTIPDPREINRGSAQAIAQQQGAAKAAGAVASAAAPVAVTQ